MNFETYKKVVLILLIVIAIGLYLNWGWLMLEPDRDYKAYCSTKCILCVYKEIHNQNMLMPLSKNQVLNISIIEDTEEDRP